MNGHPFQPPMRVVRVVVEFNLEELLQQLHAGLPAEAGSDPEIQRIAGRILVLEPITTASTGSLEPTQSVYPQSWPHDRPLSPRMVAYLARCSNNIVSDALQATSADRLDGQRPPMNGFPTSKWRISLAAAECWIAQRATRGHISRRTIADLVRRFPAH